MRQIIVSEASTIQQERLKKLDHSQKNAAGVQSQAAGSDVGEIGTEFTRAVLPNIHSQRPHLPFFLANASSTIFICLSRRIIRKCPMIPRKYIKGIA